MSLPPVYPDKTASGIALDPSTLDRVVPESRRKDGSIRKEIRIRPGFTPQEDLTRFRGTRQSQMDRITLPKGHILGWVAPSSENKPKPPGEGSTSKSAKKNEKRREKRNKMKEDIIKASWEDDDVVNDPDGTPNWAATSKLRDNKPQKTGGEKKSTIKDSWDDDDLVKDADGTPNWAETARLRDTERSNMNGGEELTTDASDEGKQRVRDSDVLNDQLAKLEV